MGIIDKGVDHLDANWVKKWHLGLKKIGLLLSCKKPKRETVFFKYVGLRYHIEVEWGNMLGADPEGRKVGCIYWIYT